MKMQVGDRVRVGTAQVSGTGWGTVLATATGEGALVRMDFGGWEVQVHSSEVIARWRNGNLSEILTRA